MFRYRNSWGRAGGWAARLASGILLGRSGTFLDALGRSWDALGRSWDALGFFRGPTQNNVFLIVVPFAPGTLWGHHSGPSWGQKPFSHQRDSP